VLTQIGTNVVEWASDAIITNYKINKVRKAYEKEIAIEEDKQNADSKNY